MNMFKRLIGMLLCLTLVLSQMPFTAYATTVNYPSGDITAAGEAKISLDYLGKGTTTTPGLPEDERQDLPAYDELQANDVLWFGIAVENMTTTTFPILENYGVGEITLAVDYDTQYLTPYIGSPFSGIGNAKFTNAVKTTSIVTGLDHTKLAWGADAYTLSVPRLNDAYTTAKVEQRDVDATNGKTLTMTFSLPDDNAGYLEYQRFYKNTDESKFYLARFPMKLINKPSEGSKVVIELGLSGADFVWTLYGDDGVQNINDSLQWDALGGGGNTNLKKYFALANEDNPFPETYTINFDMNLGDATDTGISAAIPAVTGHAKGAALGDKYPANPTRTDNKLFDSWNTKSDGTGTKVDKTTNIIAAMLDDGKDDEVTLYAQWKDGYGVTFDANGGAWAKADGTSEWIETDGQTSVTVSAASGVSLDKKSLVDPVKKSDDGSKTYELEKWVDADGNEYDDIDAVIADFDANGTGANAGKSGTVTAQWTVADEDLDEAVLVTLHPNYGNFTGMTENQTKTVTVFVGDTLGANYPTADSVERTDYTLNTEKSWNSAQNGTGTAVKADTAITVGEGGIATEVTPAVADAAKYAATLYAQWTADPENKATVTFDKNNTDEGSTDADPKTIEVTKGTAIGAGNEPNAPTRDGYDFKFWGTTAEATIAYDFDTDVDDDMTLYAIWDVAASMTVKFNAGTGTFTTQPADIENVANNYVITTADMADAVANLTAPDGYVFQQWNTQANGSGTKVEADKTALTTDMAVADVITIYAIFEADSAEDFYTVTFDKNGADDDVTPSTITVPATNEETIAALPDIPERDKYESDGKWYTDPVGGDEFVAGTTKVTEDITLYPHWTTDEEHWTVTFWGNDSAANDGKGTELGSVQVIKGEKLTMSSPTATRAGYENVRWENDDKSIYVCANAEGVYTYADMLAARDAANKYPDFTDVVVDGDINFFMVWGVTPTVTLKMADETAWDEQVYNKAAHSVAVDTVKGSDGTAEITLDNATIKYSTDDTAAPIAVGDYTVTVTFGEQTGNHPVEVCNTTKVDGVDKDGVAIDGNSTLTIKPYGLTLTLAQIDGADQQQEVNYKKDTTHDLVFSVVEDGIPEALKEEVKALTFTNKYYAVGDTAVTEQATAPVEIGLYAVVPTLGSDVTNYTIKGYNEKVVVVEKDKLVGVTENADLYAKLEIKNAASLTGIAVNYGTDGTWTAADLFDADTKVGTADKTTFAAETTDYYTQIPFGKDTQFVLTGTLPAGVATVTLNDVAVDLTDASKVTVADGTYTFDTKTIEQALTDTVNGDFSNKLVISWGEDTTYTVYLRQLVEAKITLNAGNSPYGLIERMTDWDDTKKAEAKAAFDTGNKFTAEYLPTNGDSSVVYTVVGWGDVELGMVELPIGTDVAKWNDENAGQYGFVNHDKDPNAIFAFIQQNFVDPGFIITNSCGQEVTTLVGADAIGDKVVRTINYKEMSALGIANYATATEAQSALNIVGNNTNSFKEELTLLADKYAKPGIYTIEYNYNNGEATATRTFVVVAQLGDVNLNDIPNNNDANQIKQNNHTMGSLAESSLDDRLMEYRVADLNKNGIANNNDANQLKQNNITEFYKSTVDLEAAE